MRTFFIFIAVSSLFMSAQIRSKSADVFEELDSGNLTLRFNNALTGKPVMNVSVSIENIGEYTTDDEGKVVFPPPIEDGFHQVRTRAEGYIPTEFQIEIMAGTLFFNRISLSPIIDIRFVRIVVDWDKAPRDLDAHFVRTGTNGYHISYRNMKVLADRSGLLDIDARNGYGPETITVNEVSTRAVYEYYIHDYSNQRNKNSTGLSDSKATVKVFGDGRLLNVIQVPRSHPGNIWKVFKIEQGQVQIINQIRDN